MSNKQLGELIPPDSPRDAIHIAIAPVVADEQLAPGDHIGLVGENTVSSKAEKLIGIVDPFLGVYPKKGDLFYMLLYPDTITGLHHQWTHPSFSAERKPFSASREGSEAWLREFAEVVGMTYPELVKSMERYVRTKGDDKNGWGDYHTFGYDTPNECYEYRREMWLHLRNVLDVEIPEHVLEDSPFSCSC
jgi:hypothetical protein